MVELNCGRVIVCHSYTVEVSECDSFELWKSDSVEELNCGSVIMWWSHSVEVW